MKGRLFVFFVALCLGILLCESGEAASFSWTLQEMTGIFGDIVLEGPAPEFSLYLPVPPGMRLQESVLILEYVASPALTRGATLSVFAEDVLLASFPVAPGANRIRVSLAPLEGQVLLKDTLRIAFRGDFQQSENLCEDLLSRDLFVRIRSTSRFLTDLSETPWTVRDFLRFPASRFRIFLPEDLSSRELLAAYLKISAFLRRIRRDVITETLPPRLPERKDAKELCIVLREKALRDVELFGSTLYLTPQGVESVLAALPLFVDRSFTTQSTPIVFTKKRTLQNFGMRSTTLRGIGELRQTVYFPLADLGGVPAALYLNLFSTSTPLPETPRGEAFLKVFLNGNLVFTRKITKRAQRGIQKDTIFLPPRLLGRENTLDIVFSYFPEVGECRRGTMPFEATIFEQSYFSVVLRRTQDTVTFAEAPTIFAGKAWIILPERPALEEVEVMARLYSALREIDTTPLALEVVHDFPQVRRTFPSLFFFALPKVVPRWDFRFLFTPPQVLREYFLVFDRDGTYLSTIPASLKNGTLALAPLPQLTTFSLSLDTPAGALIAQQLLGKPALVFIPLGRKDVACSAFLTHFKGAETLRNMTGNVALFTPRGWGETRVAVRTEPPLEEAFVRWRLLLFASAAGALFVWCLVLYRKLVRARPL
ncbi:cellulose biosynthesis cyclic di-GMP-binding regulatory protein BcsB [Candidatus Caldatribacterium sp.]|uniref:cellulose biosynthesis cyclic di-GMP-binding regulatory protein BcsB n=1 Tax=Candidatus Caldatribacterium sp. TaxID=2282143 RepID=UPI002996DF0B|nr:cellulose biosynthesis cyclic di-GMP-binding regulatory protein BcsB [Candidatus Caldatribacterium sp.]MDW8081278.1 cellulose biosynthesis cyclic di-GMP-binding regulatory protein BcsB [Candidatus Calescibacterium sp.]